MVVFLVGGESRLMDALITKMEKNVSAYGKAGWKRKVPSRI